ncbi:hypothetical protein AYX14_03121 [Cryptococcus neoformans]|nr:hypothetical protein AYX15_02364 [Cryptococcus neoformans var. grubii]OWZ71449.1 hypothetical protein AYX14_03121 [Cryptococcus neoformans var. grubii]
MSSTTVTSCFTIPLSSDDFPLTLHLEAPSTFDNDDDGANLHPPNTITPPSLPSDAGSTSPIALYTTTYLTRGASLRPPHIGINGSEESAEMSLKDRFIPPRGHHALAWRMDEPSEESDQATIQATRKLESLLSTAYAQCQTRESSQAAEHELFPPGSEFTPSSHQLAKTMSMLTSHYTQKLKTHGDEVGKKVYEGLDEESKSKVAMRFVDPKTFEQRTGTRLARLDYKEYKRLLEAGNGVVEN